MKTTVALGLMMLRGLICQLIFERQVYVVAKLPPTLTCIFKPQLDPPAARIQSLLNVIQLCGRGFPL